MTTTGRKVRVLAFLLILFVGGCGVPDNVGVSVPPTLSVVPVIGLSNEEVTTLSSLERLDDYPLYTMRHYGEYERDVSSISNGGKKTVAGVSMSNTSWACSLFATFADGDNALYGRNFDWDYSPALLLFTDPSDGYASVSMVDIAYLGFGGEKAEGVLDLPIAERASLLDAPFLPFDGMNEQGLAVGMAAVPPGQMNPDPDKKTLGSLMVIRHILDQASNADEAVSILESYNIETQGGPPLHYLIADRSGRAVLVEFYRGEMVVIPNEMAWHQATNFLRASAGESTDGACWRYDKISERLTKAQGLIGIEDGMNLLDDVSQQTTQWSIIYGMSTGDINVAMGREYDEVHTLQLDLTGG